MWLNKLAVWGVGLGLAVSLSVTSVAATEVATAPVAGDTLVLPEITLFDGTRLPEGYYQGKPLIIVYWASWCPFCARQNPYVEQLYDKARTQGLEVLTISIDRKESEARDYMAKNKYTFPAAMQTPEILAVMGKRRVIPKVFVVGADGKVVEVIPGEMFEEDVLDLIKYAPKQSN
ncbi:MAG: TlpA family protein disulfide reductase [Burkholderiaceae bacterium]|nr:TlpA family protein disulfide reductase [Burkholderiaceae bacterium]